MGRRPIIGVIGRDIERSTLIEKLEQRHCAFENKPCERKCIFYNTCTRNPYRYDQRKE